MSLDGRKRCPIHGVNAVGEWEPPITLGHRTDAELSTGALDSRNDLQKLVTIWAFSGSQATKTRGCCPQCKDTLVLAAAIRS